MSYIGQNEDEWESEQKKKSKKEKQKKSVRCQICGKLLTKGQALIDHMRDVHQMKPETKSSIKVDDSRWQPITRKDNR